VCPTDDPSCDERAIRACTKRSATVTRVTGHPQVTASTTPTDSVPKLKTPAAFRLVIESVPDGGMIEP
jgi:hypothetical protein